MKLRVKQAAKEDVYRDVIRIAEPYRVNKKNLTITEGSICKVCVEDKFIYAILRGCGQDNSPNAYIDERLRNSLGVQLDQEADFFICKSGLWGEFMWAWKASEPAYKIAARLSLLSVALGLLSILISIFKD